MMAFNHAKICPHAPRFEKRLVKEEFEGKCSMQIVRGSEGKKLGLLSR